MVFKNGHAVASAARHNQLDRRQNGVIDYDQTIHPAEQGPLAVRPGNSTTSVELRVRGGAANVNGTRASYEGGPIGLENGPVDAWRVVLIYIAENGSIQTQPGSPADNTLQLIADTPQTVTVPTTDGNTAQVLSERAIEAVSLEGPEAPVPEPHPADGINGTILAAAWVPPGATTSANVPSEYIKDMRRPALPPTPEGWETPALVTSYVAIGANGRRSWPVQARGGESIRFYGVTASQTGNGSVTLANNGIKVQFVDLEVSGSTGQVLWEATEVPAGNPRDGPIETFDVPSTESQHAYCVRVFNDSSETFTAPSNRIATTWHWTVTPTDRF